MRFALNKMQCFTYHGSEQTVTKPLCEVVSMIFLEVCFMSQEPSTNDNKYSQTAAEKHVL